MSRMVFNPLTGHLDIVEVTNIPLASTAPVNVTKEAAEIGVSTYASRSDHKHDIDTAVPTAIVPGATADEGTGIAGIHIVEPPLAHGRDGGPGPFAMATLSHHPMILGVEIPGRYPKKCKDE